MPRLFIVSPVFAEQVREYSESDDLIYELDDKFNLKDKLEKDNIDNFNELIVHYIIDCSKSSLTNESLEKLNEEVKKFSDNFTNPRRELFYIFFKELGDIETSKRNLKVFQNFAEEKGKWFLLYEDVNSIDQKVNTKTVTNQILDSV